MAIKTRGFDAASYLDSEEAVAEYLTAALETGDVSFIAYALEYRAPEEYEAALPRLRVAISSSSISITQNCP